MWDNIKIDLQAVGCEHMDRIYVFQDRVQRQVLVNTVKNLLVSLKAGNFLTS
jgi:hypothetical protein